jgi:hypothetical protein
MRLANCLERVHPLRVFLSNLHHFPKAAFPDHLEKVECLNRKRFIAKLLEVNFEVEGA